MSCPGYACRLRWCSRIPNPLECSSNRAITDYMAASTTTRSTKLFLRDCLSSEARGTKKGINYRAHVPPATFQHRHALSTIPTRDGNNRKPMWCPLSLLCILQYSVLCVRVLGRYVCLGVVVYFLCLVHSAAAASISSPSSGTPVVPGVDGQTRQSRSSRKRRMEPSVVVGSCDAIHACPLSTITFVS
jgi:hypothetical protein